MKINCVIPELNLNEFYNFIKLDLADQSKMLKEKAIKIDEDTNADSTVNLYFLSGFFVEETVLLTENRIVEILPFKKGYKLERFLQGKGLIELKV